MFPLGNTQMSPQHGNMCLIMARSVPIWECTFRCGNEHSQCVINYDVCGKVQYMLLSLGTCFQCLGKFHVPCLEHAFSWGNTISSHVGMHILVVGTHNVPQMEIHVPMGGERFPCRNSHSPCISNCHIDSLFEVIQCSYGTWDYVFPIRDMCSHCGNTKCFPNDNMRSQERPQVPMWEWLISYHYELQCSCHGNHQCY